MSNATTTQEKSCPTATLEVLSLMIQQLEVVAAGIGVEPAVKLEAARWHTKFSGKRQKLLLRAGK